MRVILLVLLFLLPAGLRADDLQLVLYAVAAKDEAGIPAEVKADVAKFVAYLDKMKEAGKLSVPIDVTTRFELGQGGHAAEGENFVYFKEFEATGSKLAGKRQATRKIGYVAKWTSKPPKDKLAWFDLEFDWTPGVEKLAMKGNGPEAWIPRFRSVKSHSQHLLAEGEYRLAATWRINFPISSNDKGGDRQLYLFAKWTDPFADL